MPNLSIKNVPESVLKRLRARAERHHRSIQGELLALVCAAVEQPDTVPDWPNAARVGSPPVDPTGTRTIDEIAAAHRARWRRPFDRRPRAVELIRADRDRR